MEPQVRAARAQTCHPKWAESDRRRGRENSGPPPPWSPAAACSATTSLKPSTAKITCNPPKVGAGITESDIMPPTADLPEFMPEAEFKRRFRGVNGVEYKKIMAEIEWRVAALPLYR